MDVEIISEKIECSDLKKCGEIATLLSVGKQEFFLNCGFCEYTFLQLDNFIAHMYNDHITEFPETELKKETTEEDQMLNECSTDTLESVAQEEYLKDFERVEIELDTSEANILNDNKECLSKEFDEQENESKATLTGRRYQKFQPNLNRDYEIESSEEEYKPLQEQCMKKRPSKISYDRRNAIGEKYKLNKDELESQRDLEMEISEEVIDTKKYRNKSELDNIKMSSNYDETDDDDFLQDFDESEDVDEPQTKSKMTTQKRIPDSVLDDEQFLILAEIYKSYTCLWNEVDIAYRFKNRREEAIKSLHEEFNSKSGLSLLQKDVEREIALLREICSIEKKEKLNSKRHNLKYRPKCPFYKNIAYIEVDVSPFECSICGKRLPALGHYKTHVASHDGSLPFKCHLCGHGFQVGANLTVHLRRHVQDYIYKCEICNKPCATTTELKIHMRSHTGEKPFICSVCGQKHGTSSHLLVHMLRHNNQRPHKCKICSKAFFESGTLKEHMMVHTKIRNIICDICRKGFKSKTHLYQHKLIHNKEKRYECNICKKRFAQPAGLSGHMKTHGIKLSANVSKINTEMNNSKSASSLIEKTKTNTFIALEDSQYQLLAEIYEKQTCLWDEKDIAYRFKNRREEALNLLNAEFNEITELNLTTVEIESHILHLRKICSAQKKQKIVCERNNVKFQSKCSFYKHITYLQVDVPPFECWICKKLMRSIGQYKVHLAAHDGSLPFVCHLCGHGFQLASNLTVHLRRHVQDFTYRCEQCDKPCATSTELKIHMRSHTGEKPFVCYICGQKARTSSQLLVHILRHEKRPRHKCKLCPKTFYETGTLNEHMSIHRNIRDEICEVCDKGFINRKQLRQHQLIHNSEKKYSCKICGKRFAQYAGLSGHMKTHGTKLSAKVSENLTPS